MTETSKTENRLIHVGKCVNEDGSMYVCVCAEVCVKCCCVLVLLERVVDWYFQLSLKVRGLISIGD